MSALKVGDVVRVRDPSQFVSAFAKKVTDRDGVVGWVGPDTNGFFKNRANVKFLKRNGRGKEFTLTMSVSNLVVAPPKESA